jgi:hypothetical protein
LIGSFSSATFFPPLFATELVVALGASMAGNGGNSIVGGFTKFEAGLGFSSSIFVFTSAAGVALVGTEGVLGVDGMPIEVEISLPGIGNEIFIGLFMNGLAPGKLSRPGKIGNGGKLAGFGDDKKCCGKNGFGVADMASELGGFIMSN